MKYLSINLFLALLGLVTVSSCTFGDKGSEKVPDSIRIDTNASKQSAAAGQDEQKKPVIDSLQTDSSKTISAKPKAGH